MHQLPTLQTPITTSSFLDIESVHLQIGNNVPNLDALQLETIEAQAIAWRPQGQIFTCWGFFVVNDNHLVDSENPQMLRCIIYKSKQASEINLTQ